MAMKWFGPQVEAKIRDGTARRVRAAGIHLKNRIRESVGRSQPTRGAGLKKVGLDPSKPGEYPKKVLGHLRRNIQDEHDSTKRISRVGTNVLYGKFLELGTKTMLPRPWLSNALRDFGREVRRILETGRL